MLMVDANMRPSYPVEGVGVPQPVWPLAAGAGKLLQSPVAIIIP